MKTIYSDGRSLEIERKLNCTVFLPQRCYFCDEEITKKFGGMGDSLLFHSLDGNHDNWDPENKVPTHRGCHISFHNKGRDYQYMKGDKNHMYGKPNYWGHHTDDARHRIGDGNKGNSQIGIKGAQTKRDRYGLNGLSEAAKKGWEKRRKHHGPTGHKDPEAFGRAVSEGQGKMTPEEKEAWGRAISEGKRRGKEERMK